MRQAREAKKKKPQARRENDGAAPEAAEKPGLGARQAAVKLLSAVVDRKVSLDGLLDQENGNPAYRALSPADRALVRAILSVSLRRLVTIETAISRMLEKPLPEGARTLQAALIVAAAQILFLDVPDHSAVDLAVEQANRDPRNRRFAALVNAILRRVSREKDRLLADLSATLDAPAWFVDRMGALYGPEQAAAIIAAHRQPAPIDLTVKSDPESWAARLGGTVTVTGSVRLGAFDGSVVALPGFEEGEWWVQDMAAAIPARLFGDLSGMRVADLCAAPGGKTAQLAAQGATVTAFDLSENRLKRLSANLERLGLDADCVAGDFMKAPPQEPFDAVLLDAPCSSTGTVRRHADVVWTKTSDDIARLAALQEKMLRHALTMVRPGGKVVFSNCSLDKAEGEDVVAKILADTPAVALDPMMPAELRGLEAAITPEGTIRTTPDMMVGPGISGLDGFFAARFVRRG